MWELWTKCQVKQACKPFVPARAWQARNRLIVQRTSVLYTSRPSGFHKQGTDKRRKRKMKSSRVHESENGRTTTICEPARLHLPCDREEPSQISSVLIHAMHKLNDTGNTAPWSAATCKAVQPSDFALMTNAKSKMEPNWNVNQTLSTFALCLISSSIAAVWPLADASISAVFGQRSLSKLSIEFAAQQNRMRIEAKLCAIQENNETETLIERLTCVWSAQCSLQGFYVAFLCCSVNTRFSSLLPTCTIREGNATQMTDVVRPLRSRASLVQAPRQKSNFCNSARFRSQMQARR